MASFDKLGGWLRYPLFIFSATLLAGCAVSETMSAPATSQTMTEQHLVDLERRVQRLENRPPVAIPKRSRSDMESQVSELEAERGRLLLTYTERHPAIRDIDRKLLILGEQLRQLEP